MSVFAQKDITLNGKWEFKVPGIQEPAIVQVPHTYNVMEGLEDYAGKAVYTRALPLENLSPDQKVRIHFRGVYHDAIVRVNGVEVGRHMNAGYTPFSFDITPYINHSDLGNNIVEVVCDNSYSETNMPWKHHFDWANDGGIYRPAYLHISGKKSIRYLHITPEINLSDSTATASVNLRLYEDNVKKARFTLKVKENESGEYIYDAEHQLRADEKGIFRLEIPCGKVRLWHFDNPSLYSYEITLYDGKEISDFKTESFGFRKIEIDGENILLNGEHVRLPGIEDMPGANPEKGMAESPEDMKNACCKMKDLGCTITRYHWVQDDYRLHLMDSLGVLVQEEISWWQGPYRELGDTLMNTVKLQIEEMIEAHYNHPCIWAWGLSNEVGDNREDLLTMKSFARQFDTTRYYLTISTHIWSQKENDPSMALDMPTWNEYTGTWHTEHREKLIDLFKIIDNVLNDRPLLITEAGLCEPAFTGGDARRIDDMLFHISEWQKHPYVCGYIYFCLTDYRTHIGEEGLGAHRIRRHGVCDKYSNPKPSYHVLKQLMCPIEITGVKPYGQNKIEGSLSNQYELGNQSTDAQITIRIKDNIPSYTIRGYEITYDDRNGVKKSIQIPDSEPGKSIDFILRDINHGFNFRIIRADGSTVTSY